MKLNVTIRGTDPALTPPPSAESVGQPEKMTLPDKRNTLMQVTGASLAYGMVRETIANLTARGPHGIHLLPSVSFFETKRKTAKN